MITAKKPKMWRIRSAFWIAGIPRANQMLKTYINATIAKTRRVPRHLVVS
jgi:hypothetical protein